MDLNEFKHSKAGEVLRELFLDGNVVAEMLRQPDRRPPVGALQRGLKAARLQLSNPERQHIGRWTAEVLGRYGLRPIPGRQGAKRAPVSEPGPLTTGALYEYVREPSVAERVAAAQAIVAPYRHLGTVDDFIREKREEAAREL